MNREENLKEQLRLAQVILCGPFEKTDALDLGRLVVAASRPTFTVKTRHGRGWQIPEASECPPFDSQAAAMRYAALRTEGMPHTQAWETVRVEDLDAAIVRNIAKSNLLS